MRNGLMTSKIGSILMGAIGMTMVAGSAGMWSFAQEGGGLPEGFKKSELVNLPSAEMIEAGKRVYFTKCVWCHGVEGAGDGPAAVRARQPMRSSVVRRIRPARDVPTFRWRRACQESY